jgi:hypothetical protein
MIVRPLRHFTIAAALLLAALLPGCARTYLGYGPNFHYPDDAIKRIAVLPPDIRTYEISGGGIPEYRVDLSDSAGRACSRAAVSLLGTRMFEPVAVEKDTSKRALDSLSPFVEHVVRTIQKALYQEHPFENERDSFTYSIGEVRDLCARHGADAVMFLFGIDERYSALRKKTLETEATVKTVRSGILSVFTAVFLGVGAYRVYSAMPERTWLCCCVADREGKIIWFRQYLEADNADLTRQDGAREVVRKAIEGFFRRKPQES